MTTYATGNPLGSTNPRDLKDNAENIDKFANGAAQSYPDRFGTQRKSLAGMESDFSQALINSGLESVHLTYVVGSPLTVNRSTQLIDYNGSVYRVKMPSTFPVSLTGVWATDSAKLVDIGDQALRQALASAVGTSMISRSGGTLEAFLLTLALRTEAIFTVSTDAAAFDRVLVVGDSQKYIPVTELTAVIRTIAAQSTAAWADNTTIELLNDSDTALLIASEAGVNLIVPAGKTNKVKARGAVRLKRVSLDRWALNSDLVDGKRPGPMYGFGDSITYGVGASVPENAYFTKEVALMGRTAGNQAVSASMVWDQLAVLYAFTILREETTQIMIGTNDRLARGTTSAYQQECFKAAHLAALVWMAIPDISRVYPNNANCVYSPPANWGDAAYGKINSKFAAIVGSKVTMPFFGSTVYLHYMKVDGKVATGEVCVDGILVNTINCAGSGGGTLLGAVQGAAVLRISGLSQGVHSLEINVSEGGAGGFVMFLGISVPEIGKSLPRANVMGIIRTTNTADTTDILIYNNMIQQNVNALQTDGLDVVYMDTLAYVNTTTDMYDNLHPNDAGHAKISRQAALMF